MDRSFTNVCIFFSTNFRSFRAAIEVAEQPPNKRETASKFLVPRKPMKANAILSVLVVLAAAKSATEDRFQRRRPARLTLSTHAVRSIVTARRSKALELSGQ